MKSNEKPSPLSRVFAPMRNGHLRVPKMQVKIQLGVNEEGKTRVHSCLGIFENYCTVTQSVIHGIKVNLDITEV